MHDFPLNADSLEFGASMTLAAVISAVANDIANSCMDQVACRKSS